MSCQQAVSQGVSLGHHFFDIVSCIVFPSCCVAQAAQVIQISLRYSQRTTMLYKTICCLVVWSFFPKKKWKNKSPKGDGGCKKKKWNHQPAIRMDSIWPMQLSPSSKRVTPSRLSLLSTEQTRSNETQRHQHQQNTKKNTQLKNSKNSKTTQNTKDVHQQLKT